MSVTARSFRPRLTRRSAAALVGVLLGLLAVGVWQLTRTGGPRVVSQSRSVAPFSGIALAGDNIVTVFVGRRQSVVVRAHESMLGQVTTRVRGDHLVVANTQVTKGPVSVSVGVPSLASVTITREGAGVITVDDVKAPSFTVTLAGAGVVRASGGTPRLYVSVSGSGVVELGELVARDARTVVSGSGRIVVEATRSLDASVTGDGLIQYEGNPLHIATSVTGSGAIIPG